MNPKISVDYATLKSSLRSGLYKQSHRRISTTKQLQSIYFTDCDRRTDISALGFRCDRMQSIGLRVYPRVADKCVSALAEESGGAYIILTKYAREHGGFGVACAFD